MKTTKTVRVEVTGLGYCSPFGAIAEIVPGKSIRIIGWKTVDGFHAAIKGDVTFAKLEISMGEEGGYAVMRDHLEERGLLVQSFDRTFGIGDEIEYDSYNLKYTNPILSITKQSVICHDHSDTKTKRMTLQSFISRNWDFDGAKIAAENSETMNYI